MKHNIQKAAILILLMLVKKYKVCLPFWQTHIYCKKKTYHFSRHINQKVEGIMSEPLHFNFPQYKCSYANCTIILLLSSLNKTETIWGALRGPWDLAACCSKWCATGHYLNTRTVVLVGAAAAIPRYAGPWLTCVTFLLTECLELHSVVRRLSVAGATSTTRQNECCIRPCLIILT
jgi:hypothetical protein